MNSVILPIIKSVLPDAFQEADLFEPFCEQVAALQAAKLQKYLLNAEDERNEEEDTIQLDDEVKQETIRDFLYELYDDLMKGIKEETSDNNLFVVEASDTLSGLDVFTKETVIIPIYNCSLSKKKGGKKGKSKGKKSTSSNSDKVINPLSGNRVTVDGRIYKKLIKDGYLTEEGEMTDEGREKYNEVLAKRPKKIAHPKRKGEINLGGEAYKKLLKEGYFYNEETEIWTEPPKEEATEEEDEATEEMELEDKEGSQKESEEQEEKKKTPTKKQRKVSEKIPHPEHKNRQIAKNGKAHKRYLDEGWVYDEEEGTWSKDE